MVSVPVAGIADLRTDPPAPAVHEGVVAVDGRSRAGQDGGQVLNTFSGLLVTHGFRERRIGKVVLELLGRNISALSGLSARVGVKGILEGQKATVLLNGNPTVSLSLNDELSVRDGVGGAILVDDARASGETSPSTPSLVFNNQGSIWVGTNSEAMVQGSLESSLNHTTVGPLLVEGELLTLSASKSLGETALSRLEGGDVGDRVNSRVSSNGNRAGLMAEKISDTGTSELLLDITGADGRGLLIGGRLQGSDGKGLSSEASESGCLGGRLKIIESPQLDKVILEDEGEDQTTSVQLLLSSLGNSGDDKVINGSIEIGLVGWAVAKVTIASRRGQSTNSSGGVGNTINIDGSDGSRDDSTGGGVVANDDSDVVPLVSSQNATSRNGLRAKSEVNLAKTVIRISGEAELDGISARTIGEDATSEGTREDLNFEGQGIMATKVGGGQGNRL